MPRAFLGMAGLIQFAPLDPHLRHHLRAAAPAAAAGGEAASRRRSTAVKKGDEVVTGGGHIGKVTKVDGDEVEVEFAAGQRHRVVKATLTDVRPTGAKPANDWPCSIFRAGSACRSASSLAARRPARDPEPDRRDRCQAARPRLHAADQPRPRSCRRQPPPARSRHRRRRQARGSRRWRTTIATQMRARSRRSTSATSRPATAR